MEHDISQFEWMPVRTDDQVTAHWLMPKGAGINGTILATVSRLGGSGRWSWVAVDGAVLHQTVLGRGTEESADEAKAAALDVLRMRAAGGGALPLTGPHPVWVNDSWHGLDASRLVHNKEIIATVFRGMNSWRWDIETGGEAIVGGTDTEDEAKAEAVAAALKLGLLQPAQPEQARRRGPSATTTAGRSARERSAINVTVRDLINAAVRIGVTDPLGLALLAEVYTLDEELLSQIDELARDPQLCTAEVRDAWLMLRAAARWLGEDHSKDPGGFAKTTRPKMLVVCEKYLVRVEAK